MSRIQIPTAYSRPSEETLIAPSSGVVGVGGDWVPHTAGGNASVAAANDVLYNGEQTIKYEASAIAGSNSYVTRAVNLNLSKATHITVAIYNDVIVTGTGAGLTVYLITSTPGATDLYSLVFTCQKPGWNIISRPISAFATSGSPSWATIRQVRVRVDSNVGAIRSMWFGGIWANKRSRSKVVLTFDDGYDDCTDVLNICAASEIPVGFGIIPSLIDAPSGSYLTTAELETLAASPYSDIYVHDEPQWGEEILKTQGYAALVSRIKELRRYVGQYDSRGSKYGIYPTGEYGNLSPDLWRQVLPALREAGILSCRMTVPTTVEIPIIGDQYIGYGDPLLIPSFVALNDTISLATAIAKIDVLVMNGGSAFLYGHKLDAVADSVTWVTSDFQSLINYIVRMRDLGFLDVMQYADWFEMMDTRAQRA